MKLNPYPMDLLALRANRVFAQPRWITQGELTMARLLFLVGCMIVPVLMAFAQSVPPVEKPDLKVGDRWVFRSVDLWKNEETSKFEFKVTGTNGDNIELDQTTIASKTSASVGRVSKRKADLSSWTFVTSLVSGKYLALAFPLEVGKTWEYEYSFKTRAGGTNARKMPAKVEAWEEVQVPAGKFKTLRVAHSGYYSYVRNDGKSWIGSVSEIFWYAPEVRRFVKSEYRDTNGYGTTEDQSRTELIEYEVK